MPALDESAIADFSHEPGGLRSAQRDLRVPSTAQAVTPAPRTATSPGFYNRTVLAPPTVLALQASAGNRAVARLVSGRASLGHGGLPGPGLGQRSAIAVQRLASQTSATGHTWVKLIKRADGKDNTVWSFGFWPLGGFGNPTKPVPGVVRHPDRVYEHESGGVAYMPREVDKKAFDNALVEAVKISAAHPDYTAADYNCTTFVRDVISKAGLSMPSGHKILGLKTVHNPNTLYKAASSDSSKQERSSDIDAFDLARKRATEERARQAQSSRERPEQEEIDKHPTFRLADLGEQYQGLHPTAPVRPGEDPSTVVWVKVLLVDGPRDKGTVGWVREDEVMGA